MNEPKKFVSPLPSPPPKGDGDKVLLCEDHNNGLRGTLRHNVDMRRHTSWRTGGCAERVYRPADLADLAAFLRTLPAQEPLLAVGLGSNLLVRDGGLRGTVLLLHAALNELRIEADGLVYVQAGVAGAKLARFAALHNLCSAEFFAGIPGTVGGMLAMNAGCYGSTTWDVVARVQVMTRSGELIERAPGEYEVGYRHVTLKEMGEGSPRKGEADGSPTASPLPVRTWEKGKNLGADGATLPSDETSSHSTRRAHNARQVAGYSLFPLPQEFFVGAWLRLPAGDGSVARGKIKELLTRRIASQPLNLPNAGSVFRNPPGDYAARLIEQCMLKGRQIGGARVSEKHANFIVNMGDATAADIESLINEVQAMVLQKIGIELHPEVRIVGEAAE